MSTAGRHPAGLPVKLEDVQIACNAIDLVGEDVPADFFDTGVPAATSEYLFADVGGNVCGCGGVTVSCQVDSPTLEPPAPIPAP